MLRFLVLVLVLVLGFSVKVVLSEAEFDIPRSMFDVHAPSSETNVRWVGPMSMDSKRAFSLIDLLVTIAIIAILAALLLPVLGTAKARAKRAACLNNLRQVNLGLRMYTDDFSDLSPRTPHTNNFPTLENIVDFTGYKKLMKHNVGLKGESSPSDKIFACPADAFYFDLVAGATAVSQGLHEQAFTDFSSYGFNGATGTNLIAGRPLSIAGRKISSIKEPVKTLLVFELSAIFPFSWHEPKRPLSPENAMFNNARVTASFVDGHVDYIKMYWNSNRVTVNGISYITDAIDYDPPAGYDYKWSGD